MPSNLGFTMTIKANDGTLVPLYPNTTQSQVLGWDIGEVYGPYILTLYASNWVNNRQTVSLTGVSSSDIVDCTKILMGTAEQMKAQNQAFSLIEPSTGVSSGQDSITFICTSTPTVDFQVQINWTK